MGIEYLHTMVRVKDLEASLAFYRLLGLEERRRMENEKGRFTLVFLCPPDQADGRADVELTYNWDGDEGLPSDGRHFGHLAYRVDDIYALCARLQDGGGGDQPAAAGRAHGVRALARQRVGGAAAAGRGEGAAGALGEHGEYRALVGGGVRAARPQAVQVNRLTVAGTRTSPAASKGAKARPIASSIA